MSQHDVNSSPQASGANNDQDQPAEVRERMSRMAAMMRGIPTFLTLLVLGALAYWGHSTGWTLPKFGDGQGDTITKDDWCEEHAVPDSICVECHPDRFPPPPFFEACEAHGLVNCPLCHPEVAQVHGAPATPKYDSTEAFRVMKRKDNNPDCPLIRRRLQLASLDTVDQLGLEFDVVAERDMVESLQTPGEIIYDPAMVVNLSSRTPGVVAEVYARLGDRVEQGAVLALVDSPEIAKAKAELAEAVVQFTVTDGRYTSLKGAESAVGRNTLLQAKSERDTASVRLSLARQVLTNLGLMPPDDPQLLDPDVLLDRLRFLGIPEPLAIELRQRTGSSGLYPIKASAAGNIIEVHLVRGENITSSDVLAVLADKSGMMARLALPANLSELVYPKQKIEFVPNARQCMLKGEIVWISSAIDDRTRTLEIRASLADIDEQTRVNEFGTGRIILREAKGTLAAPRRSMQWDGSCNVAFVRDKDFLKNDSPKVIHVRQVIPGTSDDEYVEILAGLLPGEIIVSKGSEILRAKLLSGNLGAG